MKFQPLIAMCMTLFSLGCCSEPADSKLTANHPAHADAQQAEVKTTPVTKDQAADATKEAVVPNPMTVCLVSGEDLGSMGKPFSFVHEGRQILLCCKSCEKEFKSDTAKFIKKFDDAVKAKTPAK